MKVFEEFLTKGSFQPGEVFLLDRPAIRLTVLTNQAPRDFAMAEFDAALYKIAAFDS
jgi:hypothetical protein